MEAGRVVHMRYCNAYPMPFRGAYCLVLETPANPSGSKGQRSLMPYKLLGAQEEGFIARMAAKCPAGVSQGVSIDL